MLLFSFLDPLWSHLHVKEAQLDSSGPPCASGRKFSP
jgi:hypothetical protein